MTDSELLEKTAKALGYQWNWYGDGFHISTDGKNYTYWNPIIDDGDALRLAVKLKMIIDPYAGLVAVVGVLGVSATPIINEGDLQAATRRAIVRTAASIGEKNGN